MLDGCVGRARITYVSLCRDALDEDHRRVVEEQEDDQEELGEHQEHAGFDASADK